MSSGCRSHSLPPAWPTIVSGGVADLKGLPSAAAAIPAVAASTYGTTKRPAPLLIHFHGWAGTLESGMVFHSHGINNGYLVTSPLGFDDEGTQPASWNGAGTSGTSGRTCYDPTGAYASLRYSRSCHASPVNGTSCGWATCEDSVRQTQELLDELRPRRLLRPAEGLRDGRLEWRHLSLRARGVPLIHALCRLYAPRRLTSPRLQQTARRRPCTVLWPLGPQ